MGDLSPDAIDKAPTNRRLGIANEVALEMKVLAKDDLLIFAALDQARLICAGETDGGHSDQWQQGKCNTYRAHRA